MKKIIPVLVVCLVLGFAPHVLAQAGTTNGCSNGAVDGGDGKCYDMNTGDIVGAVQTSSQVPAQTSQSTSGFVALAPIPGLTQGVTADQTGLANFFNNLYKYLIGLAAVLAVIEIIWGGLEISTKDSVSKQSDGKERITQAIFGLVLVLSPVLVFSIINPSILNLSLNLPKLDTQSGAPIPVDTSQICSANQTTNCTKPVCNSYRKTNCIPPSAATATQEGSGGAAPTPGLYCYERTNPNAANDFVCASTYALCDKDFQLQASYGGGAVDSCKLR